MTTKTRPGKWRGPTEDRLKEILQDTRRRLSDEAIDEIIASVKLAEVEPDETKHQSIADRLRNDLKGDFSGAYASAKLFAGRPTEAQRKAALDEIEKTARALDDALYALDSDSRAELEAQLGTEKISQVHRGAWEMVEAAKNARIATKGEREGSGKTPAFLKQRLAHCLVLVWYLATDKWPTLRKRDGKVYGPFFSFSAKVAGVLGFPSGPGQKSMEAACPEN